MLAHRECRPGQPLSVVLGAGAVRGLAHVAVLEELRAAGFVITELIGCSVGAIIAGFHAAMGLDLMELREAGLGLRSRHLLAWALARRVPEPLRSGMVRWAGTIPGHLTSLREGSFGRLHHGLERVGLLSFDLASGQLVMCHSDDPIVRLEDAVRGAAALPGLFLPLACVGRDREYRLIDGGVVNRLPIGAAFDPPFRPVQVVAVDISADLVNRRNNLAGIARARLQFPGVPIDCILVDTLRGRSIFYRRSHAQRLLDSGRAAAQAYLARPAAL